LFDDGEVVDLLGGKVPVRGLRVGPLCSADIAENNGNFAGTSVSANQICSLLNGHAYSLRLAHWLLNERRDFELSSKLSWVPPDGRTGKMVELCIKSPSEGTGANNPRQALVPNVLEHLAVFMSPIGGKVWDTCLK